MLARSSVSNFPDELANQVMMRHGSRLLLRALHGEPDEPPADQPRATRRAAPHSSGAADRGLPRKDRTRYVPVAERRRWPVPEAVQTIIESVAEAFAIPPEWLTGPTRHSLAVVARAVAIRLIRDRTCGTGEPRHSAAAIGGFFRRDHSTISHSLGQFDDYCRRYPEVAAIYHRLRETRDAA